jgi:lysozyme
MTTFVLPIPTLAWPIPYDPAVKLIAQQEGLALKAYKCIAGVWTCGYGETEGVDASTVWTFEFANQRFCDSLTHYTEKVHAMCKVFTNENELGAFVSLAYNIGLGGFKTSAVLRAHNAGDFSAAARAFGLFNEFHDPATHKKVVSKGLTQRRAAEAALYLTETPHDDNVPLPMPQAVVPQSSLVASPIAQSGVVTAGAGALGLLSTLSDTASTVSGHLSTMQSATTTAQAFLATISDAVGIKPLPLIFGLVIAAGLVAVYFRFKQRQGGHA